MTITLRSASTTTATTKGAPLSYAELDANFTTLAAQDVADRASLAADTGSSLVGFLQSGSGASLTVQEKLRQTKAVLDFVTDASVRAGIVAGTDVSDHSTYLQSALDSDFNLDFQGYTFYGNNLTDDKDVRAFVSTSGVAQIIKNANGALFTSTGDDVLSQKIMWRDNASYTGDGAVFSGARPSFLHCGSRGHAGRALKATGDGVAIIGTYDRWQTADLTASGYDIEIGVSGTATLYHQLIGVKTAHATGGILLTDTGSHEILGGQIGKLTIAAGTGPAGVNGGTTVGARILGDTTVDVSNAVLSANQFGAVDITFGAATGGCRFDASNFLQSGATVTNNGNKNNLIMREVSSGSTNQIKFGDDAAFGVMTVVPTSPGRFAFTSLGVVNNNGVRFIDAAGTGENGAITYSVAGDLSVTNAGTDRTSSYNVTGTNSGARHQFLTNGGNNRIFIINNSGTSVENPASGAATNERFAHQLLSALSGATATATNLIPAGSLVLGVTTRVTTLVEGATSYAIGDGSDVDRWGTGIAVAAGTTTGVADFTITSPVYYAAATSVVLTAGGSNFTAGAIRVVVHYISLTSPTA